MTEHSNRLEAFKQTDFFKQSNFDADLTYSDETYFDFVSSCFEQWKKNYSDYKETKIPHKIHQIWVGSRLPEKYTDWCNSWKVLNPDWEYKLWTKTDLYKIFSKQQLKWYKSCKNFGAKTDFARLVILSKFGGFYADTDFECIKNLNKLAASISFVVGLQLTDKMECGNAFIGSTPQHPMTNFILNTMLSINIKKIPKKDTISTTGPAALTTIIFENQQLFKDAVILPNTLLFPVPNFARDTDMTYQQMKDKFFKPNSIAVHWWEMSWNKPDPILVRHLKKLLKKILS